MVKKCYFPPNAVKKLYVREQCISVRFLFQERSFLAFIAIANRALINAPAVSNKWGFRTRVRVVILLQNEGLISREIALLMLRYFSLFINVEEIF